MTASRFNSSRAEPPGKLLLVGFDADPGVDDDCALGPHDDGVAVHFRDLRMAFDHRGDTQKQLLEAGDVALGRAAEAVE